MAPKKPTPTPADIEALVDTSYATGADLPTVRDVILDAKLPPASHDHGKPADFAQALARRIQAVRLKVEYGWTYDKIAAHLGYADRSSCRRAILNAMNHVLAEDITTMRAIENARYDHLHSRFWPLAIGIDPDTGDDIDDGPNVQAAKMVLDISARRARLNGLDAPQQVTISSGAAAELADALGALHEVVMGEAWEEDRGQGDRETPAIEG
jgi:hypothetical protein